MAGEKKTRQLLHENRVTNYLYISVYVNEARYKAQVRWWMAVGFITRLPFSFRKRTSQPNKRIIIFTSNEHVAYILCVSINKKNVERLKYIVLPFSYVCHFWVFDKSEWLKGVEHLDKINCRFHNNIKPPEVRHLMPKREKKNRRKTTWILWNMTFVECHQKRQTILLKYLSVKHLSLLQMENNSLDENSAFHRTCIKFYRTRVIINGNPSFFCFLYTSNSWFRLKRRIYVADGGIQFSSARHGKTQASVKHTFPSYFFFFSPSNVIVTAQKKKFSLPLLTPPFVYCVFQLKSTKDTFRILEIREAKCWLLYHAKIKAIWKVMSESKQKKNKCMHTTHAHTKYV